MPLETFGSQPMMLQRLQLDERVKACSSPLAAWVKLWGERIEYHVQFTEYLGSYSLPCEDGINGIKFSKEIYYQEHVDVWV